MSRIRTQIFGLYAPIWNQIILVVHAWIEMSICFLFKYVWVISIEDFTEFSAVFEISFDFIEFISVWIALQTYYLMSFGNFAS